MSTQFIKGGPGSGPRPGSGSKDKEAGAFRTASGRVVTRPLAHPLDKSEQTNPKLVEAKDKADIASKEASDAHTALMSATSDNRSERAQAYRVASTKQSKAIEEFHNQRAAHLNTKKSMKTIFDDALKGGPGSGCHKELDATRQAAEAHDKAAQAHYAASEQHGNNDLSASGRQVRQEATTKANALTDKANTLSGSSVSKGNSEESHSDAGDRHSEASAKIRQELDKQYNDRKKSSSFKSISENIEARVDELSLKGGPGSGRHKEGEGTGQYVGPTNHDFKPGDKVVVKDDHPTLAGEKGVVDRVFPDYVSIHSGQSAFVVHHSSVESTGKKK